MPVCPACNAELDADLPFCVFCGASVAGPANPAVTADRYAATIVPGRSPFSAVIADRYEVQAVLGRGGMGTVFRVRDREGANEVALKLLNLEHLKDPVAIARWRREVEALARVSHPNLVQILAAGEISGTPPRPFMVMPLLKGRPLDEVVREGALPAERAVAIVRGVLAALSAVHAAGLVHRDVKAGNVFLCDLDRPVLLDLGIVKPVAATNELTAAGTVVGSLEALAPEQVAGGPVDARTDVYQAGALLLHLLLGDLAFDAESTQSWYEAHQSGKGLGERVAGIPDGLARVCLKAMAVSPTDRYVSAVALADALLPALRSAKSRRRFWKR